MHLEEHLKKKMNSWGKLLIWAVQKEKSVKRKMSVRGKKPTVRNVATLSLQHCKSEKEFLNEVVYMVDD